ncbi:MAG TPA: ABC transporter ATP-binding protein, partial [Burkholderiales bacterium]|nr:ABC transporter ATP-binding protein [Burkholderiales bacterium]
MLACHALTLEIGGRPLFRSLDLELRAKELWAVLGPNGSGKTTLMQALAGLRQANAGAVSLGGRALREMPHRERARRIGLLLQQENAEFWGDVREYVLLGRYPHASPWRGWGADDLAAADRALEELGMGDFAAREYATLSGGERQRARIAQLFAQAPVWLLLDEPLQHLDLNHQVRTLSMFRERAAAGEGGLVMVLHDALWAARCCTHALLLGQDGIVASGCAADVLTRTHLEA